jgi:hypothetical protein
MPKEILSVIPSVWYTSSYYGEAGKASQGSRCGGFGQEGRQGENRQAER